MNERATPRRRGLALAGSLALLVATNLGTGPRLSRFPSMVWNLGVTASLLGLARYAGLTRGDLGLDRRRVGTGAAVGAAGSAVVLSAFAVALSRPGGRQLFLDERTSSVPWSETVQWVVIHIPLGTVFFEEVAFRGVLPALLQPAGRPEPIGPAASTALFGAWHIATAGAYRDADPSRARTEGGLDPVAQVVLATTAAGAVLAAARHAGGHLLAPALMHLTANVGANLIGRALGRRSAR